MKNPTNFFLKMKTDLKKQIEIDKQFQNYLRDGNKRNKLGYYEYIFVSFAINLFAGCLSDEEFCEEHVIDADFFNTKMKPYEDEIREWYKDKMLVYENNSGLQDQDSQS